MRALKNSLFFLLGVLLVGVPMFAYAGTYPASQAYFNTLGTQFSSASAACQSYKLAGGTFKEARTPDGKNFDCIFTTSAYPNGTPYGSASMQYRCLNGGILSGQTCNKTCPDGQSLNADGTCGTPPPKCPTTTEKGWYSRTKGTDISGTYCSGGCEFTISMPITIGGTPDPNEGLFFETSTTRWDWYSRSGTGNTCTTSSDPMPTGSSSPPTTPPKDPPCAVGEGVIGNSKGEVRCVPSGTPGSDQPKISSKSETKTYPDGSTSTTNTTNTCTGAGACTSTTTITITNSSGGGAGQAGTPGTTTGKTDKPASDQPGFCAQNPNLQICKGNMNEEATQKQVLDAAKKTLTELEKITKPTITDDSSLTEKGQFKESEELKNADKDATDRATGSIDPVSAPKSAWESAMSSGFWGPIPQSGCSPHSSKIGPFQWTFDPCPIASKISDIGAYAMWVILAISTFVMVTGGRKA